MASQSALLSLPMEMLQAIAGFVDTDTGILHLRLTCKTLAAAAFDSFAAKYVENLGCFLLNAGRLRRVKEIVQTPHLASKIRLISFTTYVFENDDDILLARNWLDRSATTAACDAFSAYEQEQLEILEAENLRMALEYWPLMEFVMQEAGRLPDVMISIDMSTGDAIHERLKKSLPQFLERFLWLVKQTGCRLSGLHLSDHHPLDATTFETGGAFESLKSDIRKFSYTRAAITSSAEDDAAISSERRLIKALSTNTLDDFCLGATRMADNPPHLNCVSELLAPSTMPSLKKIDFTGIQIRLNSFLQLLNNSQETLEELWLYDVRLLEDDEPWLEVFRVLQRFTKLKEVTLGYLLRGDPWIRPNDDLAGFVLPDLNISERFHTTFPDATSQKPVAAKEFLKLNLSHDLEYSPF